MGDILSKLLPLASTNHSTATLTSVAITLALVRYIQLWHYNRTYWSKRGVKGEKPWPIFSSLYSLFIEDRAKSVLEKTRKYGKVYGTFMLGSPHLYIADPEILRQIAIKDYDSFQNHQAVNTGGKYQRNALLWLQGEQWKRVRALMSPSFTGGRMKRMYKLLNNCANDLVDNFREQCGPASAIIDLLSTYGLYTMDGITTCGYGLKLKRQKGVTNIRQASTRDQLVRDISGVLGFKLARIGILMLLPRFILKALHFQLVPESTYKPVVERIEALIERRRGATAADNKYDDLLQSLVDARMGDQLELSAVEDEENHYASLSEQSIREDQQRLIEQGSNDNNSDSGRAQQSTTGGEKSHTPTASKDPARLNDLEIVASAIFLMAAGLDTTKASLSTISYLLAHNPNVQARLHDELRRISRVKDGLFAFEYEELTSCRYLDAVISESLRFFGPSAKTDRAANADYYIEKYKIHVPKGSHLLLGLHSVANDPDYWDEPHKFKPDRFMPGQREKIIPGSYAPFSMGPRHCLGMRFSLTETKLALAKVVMNFKFEPAPNTRYPPTPTKGISLVAVQDCRVKVTPRS